MKYKIIIILALTLLNFDVYSQRKYSISGTVTDAATGETLPGATIAVTDMAGVGVTSNAYGYYSISISPGKYNLVVSYVGYQNQSIAIELSENRTINVKLQSSATQLDDVVITARRTNENILSTEIGTER